MVSQFDAVGKGGANEEGEKRGGRQRGESDGAHPPIDKNWWGDLTTMMKKI